MPKYWRQISTAVHEHLGPTQFSRLIYGAMIGLAMIVALEHEEPDPAVMAGTLAGTGVAIGLTELYSEFLGTEVGTRRRVGRARMNEIAANVLALFFGASFPAVFFLLAAAGAMEIDTPSESRNGPGSHSPPRTGLPPRASVVRHGRRRSSRPPWWR